MNKLFIVVFALLLSGSANSQIKALTEDGREVVLFENGTWKFKSDSINTTSATSTDTIVTNPNSYKKTTAASFLIKSKIFNVGVYMNPEKWTYSLPKPNETTPEYRFFAKSQNGYAMMLTEKTEIPLEKWPYIALINAQKAAVDAQIVKSEYRTVNGVSLVCVQLKGTIQGIKFVYLGYYYSNKNGSVQFLTYTSESLFEQSKKELEDFLNGFIVTP